MKAILVERKQAPASKYDVIVGGKNVGYVAESYSADGCRFCHAILQVGVDFNSNFVRGTGVTCEDAIRNAIDNGLINTERYNLAVRSLEADIYGGGE